VSPEGDRTRAVLTATQPLTALNVTAPTVVKLIVVPADPDGFPNASRVSRSNCAQNPAARVCGAEVKTSTEGGAAVMVSVCVAPVRPVAFALST